MTAASLPASARLPATAVAAVAGVLLYALLLSREGVPASAAALLAVLLAATLSSVAGFAFSAIAGAMLLRLIDDPVQAVQVMMLCSVAIQSLSVALLRRSLAWADIWPFLLGGLLGLPIGLHLLLHLGQAGFVQALGGLLTLYAGYALLCRPPSIRGGGRLADAGAGFVGGITGGLAGFPGAFVTIWCGMRGWDKQRQRGAYQPFILVMQIAGLGLIRLMHAPGASGRGVGLEALQYVPVALLGTSFGLGVFRRLSDRMFTRAINLALLAAGIGLLV